MFPHLYRNEMPITRTSNGDYGLFNLNKKFEKILIKRHLLKILRYSDLNQVKFLQHFTDAVAIKSISSDPKYLPQMDEMILYVEKWFTKLGIRFERINLGYHEVNEKEYRLPYVILASYGNDSSKRTVCVYLPIDVKIPKTDEWKTDPWVLTQVDTRLYGNGAASTKKTFISWMLAVKSFQECNVEIPVNLKFLVEGMYHCKSKGLEPFLDKRKQSFFGDVDNLVVCESEWLTRKRPCLIYGTVGTIHFDVFVSKKADQTCNIKEDIEKLCENLQDDKGNVKIPHINDLIAEITPFEEQLYDTIMDFDLEEVRKHLPEYKRSWSIGQLFMSQWRTCSIWIGPTEECTCDNKDNNIVKKHILLKIVPSQIVSICVDLTTKYFCCEAKRLGIESEIRVEYIGSNRFWLEDVTSRHYTAAARAIAQVYKKNANIIREDRSSILLSFLDRVLEIPILLLPMTNNRSNYAGTNENTEKLHFLEGVKVLAAYLVQYGELPDKLK